MSYLFKDSEFNGDISNWNLSNITDMNDFEILCNIEINNISDFNKYKVIISEINRRKSKNSCV